jgi:membrane-bound serine protease (ClpP class)
VDPIAWAIALLVAAMLLCFVEVFIPSLGVITMFAVCCAAGSCYFGFQVGGTAGIIFIPANLLGMLASFALAFKLLPMSPLAHKKSAVEDTPYQAVTPVDDLAGTAGVAFTDLRPGGTAIISERKVDVVAEGGYIEEGARIKVLRVEGTKVVVDKEIL